ncbi:hypothetical protein RISK_000065 [Rhodopirellula islandica]|uniref:Uncharacterized protein n=1 Tax=Rhodopirellula islandica TaxID=595434 RepID=A0A0J1BN45_RHOIS|nr:hypothetical protein RISK_000065 [Rhodopirellula islandica]
MGSLAHQAADLVVSDVTTHVGWALLPVRVVDVGQEWPTDNKINSPSCVGLGLAS